MKEFERIRVEKGQAYIRDTGITVSEVVSLYLAEKDMQLVFQQYPDLETEDIFEALGYAIQNTHEMVSSMGHDMRVPLSTVHGLADLLLLLPQDRFTDEQRLDFIQRIQKNVVSLENFFTTYLDWNHLYYNNRQALWEKSSLNKAIASTFQLIQNHWRDAIINGQILDNLPQVKSNYLLPNLLYRLAGDDCFGSLKHEVTWREITSDKESVFISIERPFAKETVTFAAIEGFLSWSLSPVALAAEMLKKHGSKLELIPGDKSVIFKFSLPIWKENIKEFE